MCSSDLTSLAESTDMLKRFEAYGWNAMRVDGHDANAIADALRKAQSSDKPTLIACKTIIGFGAPKRQGTSKSHGEPLGAEEISGARAALAWPHGPFELPEDVVAAWRALGARGQRERKSWEAQLAGQNAAKRDAFETALSGEIPASLGPVLAAYKEKVAAEKPSVATRKASEMAIEVVNAQLPTILGGSADLTGSNLTRAKEQKTITASDYSGNYIHYGVREHGMAAAMNGVALHGGLVPYSGTFLVFSDYCRPALRMAAIMGKRVIHVMTHDSIGLGEDGPTHQPIEHLAALRAIPNLLLMRPADAVEVAECWELALSEKTRPTVMALSRQAVPTIRGASKDNLCAKGAYVFAEADGKARVTFIATGSEVEIALKAHGLLKAKGVPARVVSMPCWELFEE